MAITSLTISQTNGNVLSAFNPVVFICDAAWNSDAPTSIKYELKYKFSESESISIIIGNATFYKDLAGVRQFLAIVSEPIQSKLTDFEDFTQTNGTIVKNNNQLVFKIRFYDPLSTVETNLKEFIGIACSRQIGENINLTDVIANDYPKLIAFASEPFYIPFWSENFGDYLRFSGIDYTPTGIDTFYRLKTTKTQGTYVAQYFSSDLGILNELEVEVRENCTDGILIKYLDKVGIYRFWQFNRFYDVSDTTTEIGQLNNFITSIVNGVPEYRQIGKTANRKYILTSEVNTNDIEHIQGMYTSPVVYAKLDGVWQIVNFDVLNKQIKLKKGSHFTLSAEISLPDRYTVTK